LELLVLAHVALSTINDKPSNNQEIWLPNQLVLLVVAVVDTTARVGVVRILVTLGFSGRALFASVDTSNKERHLSASYFAWYLMTSVRANLEISTKALQIRTLLQRDDLGSEICDLWIART